MFKNWFKRRATELIVTINPWEGSGGFYVAGFRRHLEGIAQKLSEAGWRRVKVSFNQEFGCAELHDADKGIIARVKVHGSECSPYEAIVRTDLPAEMKEHFSKAFPFDTRFQALSVW